jgi:hypothetical protein
MFQEQQLRKQFINKNLDSLNKPIGKWQVRKEEVKAY